MWPAERIQKYMEFSIVYKEGILERTNKGNVSSSAMLRCVVWQKFTDVS
jgi:hypothetical protein